MNKITSELQKSILLYLLMDFQSQMKKVILHIELFQLKLQANGHQDMTSAVSNVRQIQIRQSHRLRSHRNTQKNLSHLIPHEPLREMCQQLPPVPEPAFVYTAVTHMNPLLISVRDDSYVETDITIPQLNATQDDTGKRPKVTDRSIQQLLSKLYCVKQ